MNISRLPGSVIRDLDTAIGKRLRRNIKAGNYLRQNMLAVPPLIQKGDKVKLVARSGNIKIVTYGTAREPGGAGEQIRIENLTSEKTILGRVIDASTVDVIF
jgi:flagella basal body P-ring formation protein FlgA